MEYPYGPSGRWVCARSPLITTTTRSDRVCNIAYSCFPAMQHYIIIKHAQACNVLPSCSSSGIMATSLLYLLDGCDKITTLERCDCMKYKGITSPHLNEKVIQLLAIVFHLPSDLNGNCSSFPSGPYAVRLETLAPKALLRGSHLKLLTVTHAWKAVTYL